MSQNKSIKSKLVLIGLLSISLIFAVGLIGYIAVSKLSEANQISARHTDGLRMQLETDMMHDALRADVFNALLAASRNDVNAQDAIQADLAEHSQQLRDNFTALDKLHLGGNIGQLVDAARQPLEAYAGDAQDVVTKVFAGSDPEKSLAEFLVAFKRLEVELATLSDAIEKSAEDTRDFANSKAQSLSLLSIVAVGIACPLMLVVLLLTGRDISARIGELHHFMQNLSGRDADLTQRLHIGGSDEIAATAQSFNKFMATLEELVIQVDGNARLLSTAAHELVETAQQMTSSSEHQSETASAIATTVQSVTLSLSSVAQRVKEVHAQSQEGCRQTSEGQQNLHNMVTEIKRVEAAVMAMADSGKEFVRSAAEITDMTRQVKEIADQTNLLALNAAIEAARAGDQGRGFAVVADEVRNLAKRSAHSAEQIDAITSTLAQRSTDVENAIADGLAALATGNQHVNQVVDTLSIAEHAVIEASQGVNNITLAIQEQTAASHEIARNVDNVAKLAEQNHSAVQITATSANSVKSLSSALHQLVGRFKVTG